MRSWKRSVLCLLTISVIASWSVCAVAEPRLNDAQVDSLVWDIQHLERELLRAENEAARDSTLAAIRISLLESELAYARENERKWYHDPRIHFLFGAAAATVVMATAVRVSF